MPSSRGSSPLSSATPSPPPDAGPSDRGLGRSPNSITSTISSVGARNELKRDARSPTSSTAVKSNFSDDDGDESELTEEDEEDEADNEPTGDLAVKRELIENPFKEDGDADDEPLSVADELSEQFLSPKTGDRHSIRSSPSPSLTPPPPSGGMQTKRLPDLIREPVSSASSEAGLDDDEEADEDQEVYEQDQDENGGQNVDEQDHRAEEEDDDVGMERAQSSNDHKVAGAADTEGQDGIDVIHPPHNTDASQIKGEGVKSVEQSVSEVNVDVTEALDGEQPLEDISSEEQDKVEVDNENDASDTPTVPLPSRPSHPSHAPPPSAAHLRTLLILEIKFAALRDKLYVERMEEAAAEEQMILDGTHPALRYLYKTLAGRRERLHEVASKRHEETMSELKRARESDKAQTWSCWTEERDQLQWEEFEATWSKRRRLAREKNEIETVRYVKPIPKVGNKVRTFDWTAGASPAKASEMEIARDLAALDARNLQSMQLAQQQQAQLMSRHASPAMFAAAVHSHPPLSNPSTTLSSAINGASVNRAPATNQTTSSYAYNSIPTTYNPPRPVPVHNAHAGSSQLLSAGPSRPTTQARPQGRTVPTTSDLFDTGRKEATAPISLPWMKSDPVRPVNGLSAQAAPSSAATKPDEPQHSRFPGLAEYLSSTRPPNTGNSAAVNTGYGGGILNGGSKILSPPKQSTGGLLGAFGARPPGSFASAAASATTAGTNFNRLP